MSYKFKQLTIKDLDAIVDLVEVLNDFKISKELLKQRFKETFAQQYECVGILFEEKIVGVCGLWFLTRHYSGKSVEVDHVFIEESHRGNGLGKKFFNWIYNYLKSKGQETVELNTYVGNQPSHKFYYNEGFNILGYHFVKKL